MNRTWALLGVLLSSPIFAAAPIRFSDGHFFLKPATDPIFAPLRPPLLSGESQREGCRDRIERLLCRVAPVAFGSENQPRECLGGVDVRPAARALEKIYDVYPKVLQKVFCSLDVIYLEDDFLGTAYAGMSDIGTGAILGIRSALLLAPENELISMSQWITWKEQLSFGGDKQISTPREDLIKVDVTMNAHGASDFLYYVIAHEFGHVLDFANNVNDFDCGDFARTGEHCPPKPQTWSEISWDNMVYNYEPTTADPWGVLGWELLPVAMFEHREVLCFYACAEGGGNAQNMRPLYDGLQSSNLITTYASTNPWDDFAESVAFYAGTHFTDMQYVATLPDGERYDFSEKYKTSAVMQPKRLWLEAFFERDDLNYPNSESVQAP